MLDFSGEGAANIRQISTTKQRILPLPPVRESITKVCPLQRYKTLPSDLEDLVTCNNYPSRFSSAPSASRQYSISHHHSFSPSP